MSTINLLDYIHSSGQDNEIQNTGCIIVCETDFRSGQGVSKLWKNFIWTCNLFVSKLQPFFLFRQSNCLPSRFLHKWLGRADLLPGLSFPSFKSIRFLFLGLPENNRASDPLPVLKYFMHVYNKIADTLNKCLEFLKDCKILRYGNCKFACRLKMAIFSTFYESKQLRIIETLNRTLKQDQTFFIVSLPTVLLCEMPFTYYDTPCTRIFHMR